MAKTDKTDKKIKKADKKTGRKCGAIALLLSACCLLYGCAQTGAQPSRSQTLNNDFKDCIVVVAARATVTNTTVVANSEDGLQPIELFTQTMKNEGSESVAPTATPTNTTDIKPQTDVNTTGGRTAGVLESIVGAFGTWLTTPSGKEAAVESAKTTTGSATEATTGTCTTGNCTTGNCTTGQCSECTANH